MIAIALQLYGRSKSRRDRRLEWSNTA